MGMRVFSSLVILWNGSGLREGDGGEVMEKWFWFVDIEQ